MLSNAAFSFNWVDGMYMADYTNGEVIYQVGATVGYLFLFIAARLGAKGWLLKLSLNWIIELYVISLWFTIYRNPYAMNWDKFLFLEISLSGFAVFYLLCYLFPGARRIII